ncbi:MAG: TldD/PmbA family protein [Theionarchaea archaeon]|nr:TldD/PmbA family protein [Theionarchaea archaeon]
MDIIEEAIELALREGAEFIDVRVLRGKETHIYVENGETKIGGALICDANLRVFMKGCWGVCSGNDLTLLNGMVESAVKMTRAKKVDRFSLEEYPFSQDKICIDAKIRPDCVDSDEKVEYIRFLEDQMKIGEVKKTSIFYRDSAGMKSVYNSKGAAIEEEVLHTSITATATAKRGERIERASARKYICGGYEHFKDVKDLPLLAARRALNMLTAHQIEKGKYTAIYDPLLTGTLVHEILGHCAEADLILQGNSVLKDRLGTAVAPEGISVYDDPSVPLAPVNYQYDDEGVAARKKPIIQDGILSTYLHSLDTASQMSAQPGNARCEDYSFAPLVRMSNTYVLGSEIFEENEGLILQGTLGGEVEPGTGRFFIRPVLGELIEDGNVTKRFKDMIVVGDILETLQSIESVGSDFYIDSGTCEKKGQTIFIGSGGASLKVSNAVVIGG